MKKLSLFEKLNSVNVRTRYWISLAVVIVGLLLIIGGTSYAILKGNATSRNEHVIKAGSVELTLTENYDNISGNVLMLTDADGLIQDDVYAFNIRNTGNSPAKFDLKLVNEAPSGYIGNVLNTKYIKVGLEVNGEEVGPISLEAAKNIIDSNTLAKNEIINYKMRIWLDSSKESEIVNFEKYKAFLKLSVDAEQREIVDLDESTFKIVYSLSSGDVSVGNVFDSIAGYTTDYTTLNKTFFLKHNIGSDNKVKSNEVCYILNETLYCLKGGSADYYEENKSILFESIGEGNCSVSSFTSCSVAEIGYIKALTDGYLSVDEGLYMCQITSNGNASCNEI